MYRHDASVESANTPTPGRVQGEVDHNVYRCMVTKVLYVDDNLNITKESNSPQVLYDVVVLGGFQEGQIISNVRLAGFLGGELNYHERVLRKTTNSKNLHKTPLHDHDGDIVFVTFLQGSKSAPMIIGLGVNPLDKTNTGATKDDGPRSVEQFNGIHKEINKYGELTLQRKGGNYDSDSDIFTPNTSSVSITESYLRDQIWKRFYDEGLTTQEDGINDKVTRTFNGGMTIEEDGKNDKVTVTTSAGVVVLIDGTSNKITLTAGSTIINIDGASGKIELTGSLVDVGTAASALAALGPQVVSWLASHSHIVPVTGGSSSGSYPSNPPTIPPPASMLSTSVKLKS